MAININYNLDPSRTLPKIDEVSATEVYFGYATTGTKDDEEKWKVIKMVKNGNITTFQYVGGNEMKLSKWSERTSNTFSR